MGEVYKAEDEADDASRPGSACAWSWRSGRQCVSTVPQEARAAPQTKVRTPYVTPRLRRSDTSCNSFTSWRGNGRRRAARSRTRSSMAILDEPSGPCDREAAEVGPRALMDSHRLGLVHRAREAREISHPRRASALEPLEHPRPRRFGHDPLEQVLLFLVSSFARLRAWRGTEQVVTQSINSDAGFVVPAPPTYMFAEQCAEGKGLRPERCLFPPGVTLFHLGLAPGRPPFPGGGCRRCVITKHMNDCPHRHDAHPEVERGLCLVVPAFYTRRPPPPGDRAAQHSRRATPRKSFR